MTYMDQLMTSFPAAKNVLNQPKWFAQFSKSSSFADMMLIRKFLYFIEKIEAMKTKYKCMNVNNSVNVKMILHLAELHLIS